MRLQVKGKNVEVTPSIREYAERKLAKLDKQLAEPTQVEVELSEEKNPSIHDSEVAEGTIFTKGPTLRAREASPDIRASIDQLVEKLERQVKRYREKRQGRAAPATRAPQRQRVSLFRRRDEPLHVRLAREGRLDRGSEGAAPAGRPVGRRRASTASSARASGTRSSRSTRPS